MYWLLFFFAIKHIIIDWYIRPSWIADGKYSKDWVLPLFVHTLLHGIGTFIIVWYTTWDLELSAIFGLSDQFAHAAIDRCKTILMQKGYNRPRLIVGDQILHGLTYLGIIYFLWY